MVPSTPDFGRSRPIAIAAALVILMLSASDLRADLGTLFLSTDAPAPSSAAPVTDTAAVNDDRSVLMVNAEGRIEVAPDRARISFAVETEAETAREAGEANARLMDRVVEAVSGTGIDGLRTQTSGYALTPRYQPSRSDQPRVIIGYTARNQLQVIMDDVEEVGRLLDIALDAGANRVTGLQFEVQDPEPHRQEALRKAVSSARAEAETVADALGVRLGAPVEVQTGGHQAVFRSDMQFARAEMMAMDAPTTPVEAGLQTISATVSIRYRVHP